MQLATDGIVLRSFRHEDNRILTLLTREFGVLTAFANGANRPRSPLAATTELLCYSDFRLFKRGERYFVDSADSKRIFFGLRAHYENFALASYWAQLFSELSPRQENAEEALHLLLGCLHYLEDKSKPSLQLKAIAELRLLTLSGYMPNLVGCIRCGQFEVDKMYFSLEGELLCGECPVETISTTRYPVSPSVLAALRHIVYADSRKIYSFTLSEHSFQQLGKITESYLLHQLGKTLPTLEFYRQLSKPQTPSSEDA